MKDLLLITPPFTQLNTPYPATAYLKGFLQEKDISSFQVDLGIEVILSIFSKDSLSQIFEYSAANKDSFSENALRIYALRSKYCNTIDDILLFLQGQNETLARQICTENFLPQASRFSQLDEMEWAFGSMGIQDKAKHLATLYIEDLSDFIIECVDPNFGFSRYAERLGRSANSFDELYSHIQDSNTYIDQITIQILESHITNVKPSLICFSVPFPGNLYSAFRCAKYIKEKHAHIKIAMGGGFPTTELRELTDVRVFEFFDFISIDDGELPIELLAYNVCKTETKKELWGTFKRTFILENNSVVFKNNSELADYKQAQIGCPDYSDLLLNKYISVIELLNPMHSLWSNGRWNKLTMAHGCYWGKCTFCDGSLDYIKHHDPIAAKILVDRVEQIIKQTGERGFHFVDEAAPPALMKAFALELLSRQITISWWTNVRFEKNFSLDLCRLLKASGCIAVSGGLEVASDRLLTLINKGTSVEQVARVTNNLTEAGIMVHAYLMYGFPSQTEQETIDSLEMVRQMIELGIIQSGFWHQFALTAHSPIGNNPKEYGITPDIKKITFANNDVQFTDSTKIDHSKFSYGLKKSLYNYMHGIGFEIPLNEWFECKTPKTSIAPNYIISCIETHNDFIIKPAAKIYWLGGEISIHNEKKNKVQLRIDSTTESATISLEKDKAIWLIALITKLLPEQNNHITFAQIKTEFENEFDNFELFWYAKPINKLRELGLIAV